MSKQYFSSLKLSRTYLSDGYEISTDDFPRVWSMNVVLMVKCYVCLIIALYFARRKNLSRSVSPVTATFDKPKKRYESYKNH